ncbi:MAG: hypothetical protein ACT4RN_04235 [Pseudonocardia sp.]
MYRDQMLIGGSAAPRVVDDVLDDRSVETAAYSTINAVQDVFAEELTTPWPASSGDMPDPGTRVTDGVLLAWFGSAQQPVVALEPIDISGRSDEPA